MSFIRKKVVMLESKKYSDISKTRHNRLYHQQTHFDDNINYYHLYIISDEEIKTKDWIIMIDLANNADLITQCTGIDTFTPKLTHKECSGYLELYQPKGQYKKIIAITNQSLELENKLPNLGNKTVTGSGRTIQSLPQLSQQFIKKYIKEYNKGNQIVDVLVEYELEFKEPIFTDIPPKRTDTPFPNDIPKLKIDKNNTITIKKVKDSWSKEEVTEFAIKYGNAISKHTGVDNDGKTCYCTLDKNKWIKENL